MDDDKWYRDAFAPIIELTHWIRSIIPREWNPRKWRRPKLNYITVHYLYMIGTTILWSIMLYPAGGLAYIDALFFAAGTSTQSGLNTVNINDLHTYQQVVFMLGCCICTPIWINTIVVFVRLYWFERRFEHIVKEIRANRQSKARTRTLSFSNSQAKSRSRARDESEEDSDRLEKGIRGKPIKFLGAVPFINKPTDRAPSHNVDEKKTLDPIEGSVDPTPAGSDKEQRGSTTDGDGSEDTIEVHPNDQNGEGQDASETYMGLNPRINRGITFADELSSDKEGNHELARVPEQQDMSKHIEFLQRQQANAQEGGAYRIPGPREMDEGDQPEMLDRDQAMRRLHSRNSIVSANDSIHTGSASRHSEHSPDARRIGRGITIEEPDHPGHRGHDWEEDAAAKRDQSRSGMKHRASNKGMRLGDGNRSFARTFSNRTKEKDLDPMPYLSWTATTGRNSAFLGLTAEQRDELGGIEYRALKTLAVILIGYFVGIHLLGLVVLLPWILNENKYANIVRSDGQNPAWWGVFTPASMFNDLGFTLTPDSMISFQDATLPLLFGSFLIVVGNTGFPCFLRFIIWVISKVEYLIHGPDSDLYLEVRFLLDHPRRCFTLLFPSKATWWLFWVLILLNGIDLIFFIILDLNTAVVDDLPGWYQVLNGLFQAVSTRTAGFASVNLANLHAAIQVSYLIMMYISVFPIAISVRRTNVYEEKSLGIFGGEEDVGDNDQSYVSQHLRRQLSFDLWYIFLGLFIIAIVEGDRIQNVNQPDFTTFSVLFEIVSAYGTVGLSLGYGDTDTSFSAQFRVLSKLVIIAMMIRGRHRGLPYALDRAILLPSEKLQQKEAEESERQLQRRGSVFTQKGDWQDGDVDDAGLPRQHVHTSAIDPMATHAGGEDEIDGPVGLRKSNTRRSTALSTQSKGEKRHSRSKSLSRVIAGGLSAGPTSFSKRD